MNSMQPLYLIVDRSDEFIATLQHFCGAQASKEQRRLLLNYVAVQTCTRYVDDKHEVCSVSARFVAPATLQATEMGQFVSPPVVVCYDLPGLPEGGEHARKIHDACKAFNLRVITGALVDAAPAVATAAVARASTEKPGAD